MIRFSAYLYDQDIDNYGVEEAFLVHSCGRISLEKKEKTHIYRPNGRKDYQIIYVYRGKGHFILSGKEYVLNEGSVIVYEPDEIQDYMFSHSEQAEFYWMHFSGHKVPEIIRETYLNKKIMKIGQKTVNSQLFDAIIRELMLKRWGYKEITNLKGKELLWILSRSFVENNSGNNSCNNDRMEEIVEKINLQYDRQMHVNFLAQEYGTSVSWFIKEFRDFTGYTPKQYIMYVRLNRAKELLESTNHQIKEIAYMCGFDNPLYFSRIFQQHYKISASEYRKKIVKSDILG